MDSLALMQRMHVSACEVYKTLWWFWANFLEPYVNFPNQYRSEQFSSTFNKIPRRGYKVSPAGFGYHPRQGTCDQSIMCRLRRQWRRTLFQIHTCELEAFYCKRKLYLYSIWTTFTLSPILRSRSASLGVWLQTQMIHLVYLDNFKTKSPKFWGLFGVLPPYLGDRPGTWTPNQLLKRQLLCHWASRPCGGIIPQRYLESIIFDR